MSIVNNNQEGLPSPNAFKSSRDTSDAFQSSNYFIFSITAHDAPSKCSHSIINAEFTGGPIKHFRRFLLETYLEFYAFIRKVYILRFKIRFRIYGISNDGARSNFLQIITRWIISINYCQLLFAILIHTGKEKSFSLQVFIHIFMII